MSRTISFRYAYPYFYFSAAPKYGMQWSDSRYTLNGCYTYPLVFNTAVSCNRFKIQFEIENTGSGTVLGRSWQLKAYRQSYGWYDLKTFTMPDDGVYTADAEAGYTITMIAVVPSSNPGSSRSWTTSASLQELIITETATTADLATGQFQYGMFPNYYGITQQLNEAYVNMGGALTVVTDILVNIDGALVSLPKVYSGYFKSTSEQMKVFEFNPAETAEYRIRQKSISGDHEIRLYDIGYNLISEGYFYNQAFALTGGSLYYISVTHYYSNTNTGESYLQIHKI